MQNPLFLSLEKEKRIFLSLLKVIFSTMKIKKSLFLFSLISLLACSAGRDTPIDREGLVKRHNPYLTSPDPLSSLSVGNGEFAFTVDITGLQTFQDAYEQGVPLGTQSQWGWHSFPNDENFKYEETLKEFDFGKGTPETYPVDRGGGQRDREAYNWFRANPHRLHLGSIGLEVEKHIDLSGIKEIRQELDMWNGSIHSRFTLEEHAVEVQTIGHPYEDGVGARITSGGKPAVKFHFAYPTGEFGDDGCDWTKNDKHTTTLVSRTQQSAILKREIDATVYYVKIEWEEEADLFEKERNYYVLAATGNVLSFHCTFSPDLPRETKETFEHIKTAAAEHWQSFWKTGGAVDFSACTDPRAAELERRVVLSQYLLAIQSAGSTPPQETGLTYNSWYVNFIWK